MNLATIVSNFIPSANDDIPSDFDLPSYKPEYFFVGDIVVNDETGECGVISDIMRYPYAIDGDFNHGVWCAYVTSHSNGLNSGWVDHWLYDDMSLWISIKTVEGWS